MSSIVAVARKLIERDPRRAAETMLDYLAGVNFARSSALYAVEESGLRQRVGRDPSQAALDWIGETFLLYPELLRAGLEVRAGSNVIVPLIGDGQLAGLLYFDAEHVDPNDVSELTVLLIAAIVGMARTPSAPDPITEYLVETPTDAIERQRLLALLNRHEWNVARVAREVGVTRRTLYLRMERYKIQRVHIPKSRPRGSAATGLA